MLGLGRELGPVDRAGAERVDAVREGVRLALVLFAEQGGGEEEEKKEREGGEKKKE